jgi:hypothetical protein
MMDMNSELGRMCKEIVVACIKVVLRHIHRRTGQKYENETGQQVPGIENHIHCKAK